MVYKDLIRFVCAFQRCGYVLRTTSILNMFVSLIPLSIYLFAILLYVILTSITMMWLVCKLIFCLWQRIYIINQWNNQQLLVPFIKAIENHILSNLTGKRTTPTCFYPSWVVRLPSHTDEKCICIRHCPFTSFKLLTYKLLM